MTIRLIKYELIPHQVPPSYSGSPAARASAMFTAHIPHHCRHAEM